MQSDDTGCGRWIARSLGLVSSDLGKEEGQIHKYVLREQKGSDVQLV